MDFTRRNTIAIITAKLVLLFAVFVLCTVAKADDSVRNKAYKTAEPNAVKAALIFNFTRYVRWEEEHIESNSNKLTVGFYGRDSCNGWLHKIASKGTTAQGCEVEVKVIHDLASVYVDVIVLPADTKLSAYESNALKNFLDVLIVTESEKLFKEVGMVLLSTDKDQFYFEVHKGRLDNAGLTVNSRMLQAAEVVHEDPEPEEGEQSS